jgi:hypothetical protein
MIRVVRRSVATGSTLAGTLFALLFTLMGNAVMAGTPDGQTPANEGVCDVLKGGTPGLYGLCVAYCEAQDLDSIDKNPPSTRILDNYNRKKQDGDPPMPCMQVPCPCWTDEELAAITADGLVASCLRQTDKIQLIDNAPKTHFAEADQNTGGERCRYIDLNVSPPIIRSNDLSETPADAQACYSALDAACSALGL